MDNLLQCKKGKVIQNSKNHKFCQKLLKIIFEIKIFTHWLIAWLVALVELWLIPQSIVQNLTKKMGNR